MRACILECLTNTIEYETHFIFSIKYELTARRDLHFWRELAAMVETMNEILRRLKA